MYQDIKGLVKNFDNINSLLNSINTTKMTNAVNGLISLENCILEKLPFC